MGSSYHPETSETPGSLEVILRLIAFAAFLFPFFLCLRMTGGNCWGPNEVRTFLCFFRDLLNCGVDQMGLYASRPFYTSIILLTHLHTLILRYLDVSFNVSETDLTGTISHLIRLNTEYRRQEDEINDALSLWMFPRQTKYVKLPCRSPYWHRISFRSVDLDDEFDKCDMTGKQIQFMYIYVNWFSIHYSYVYCCI